MKMRFVQLRRITKGHIECALIAKFDLPSDYLRIDDRNPSLADIPDWNRGTGLGVRIAWQAEVGGLSKQPYQHPNAEECHARPMHPAMPPKKQRHGDKHLRAIARYKEQNVV
jgi:hypothetical protein